MQDRNTKYFLGIDIGGTKCAAVLGDSDFNIHKKIMFPTKSERGYKAILDEMHTNVDSILSEFPEIEIVQIGISCGGPLSSEEGMIYSPPNLPGWDEVPIVEIFEKKYGIPTALQNDANACALAEWIMGAGKGSKNMIFLTFGTGLGAGLILNNNLYSGTNDLGGEVGHIRLEKEGPVGFGKEGSFEGFCSGGGIAQLAETVIKERVHNGNTTSIIPDENGKVDAKAVAVAAAQGDKIANEIIKVSAEYLGKGISILIDILNPQCIVIGSIYTRNEELFKPHMERILKEECITASLNACTIKPAVLGDSIGDYAALCVALNENNLRNKERVTK